MIGERPSVLLTGATGYVGGRLLHRLEERGYRVRCLVRRPESLTGRTAPQTEVVKGDVLDADSLGPAMEGVGVAYYLVHSMGSDKGFAEQDRRAAENFARAAEHAGVRRIVYLGGLGEGEDLSDHLRSRQEVGRILRESSVQAIELRTSIVIGSGSLSFEMVRTLVERLPVMLTPRWTRSLSQPVAIEDVLDYLLAASDIEIDGSAVFEIGGADRVSYVDIMREFGRQRGLGRLIVPVPVLTPKLSSLWLALVTPLLARVGRKLVESVKNDTVVTDDSALRVFSIRPRGIRDSIARALANEDREFAETRWSDALSSSGRASGFGGERFGARLLDSRVIEVAASPAAAFRPIRRIGGGNGWYCGNWLWRIRGLMDRLAGGVGLRRGRRDPEHLLPGDTVDFWRVEAVEDDHLLRLYAEMKLPGRAWLQFEVEPTERGSRIRQTAVYDPIGLVGLLYWYAVFPLHAYIFGGMLRAIADRAEMRGSPGAARHD